jgi:hypothetical protein
MKGIRAPEQGVRQNSDNTYSQLMGPLIELVTMLVVGEFGKQTNR